MGKYLDFTGLTYLVSKIKTLINTKADKTHTHNYIPLSGSTAITGALRTNGEIQSTSANAFRLAYGKYGCILRNDGSATYVLLTNENDSYGSWNDLRPLIIDNSTGFITFNNGIKGNLTGTASNADTVDGCHAYQMQTLDANGGNHGSAWLMQVRHNVDGDGYFKLFCGDGSVGTKVDRATTAGSASNSDTVDNFHVSTATGNYLRPINYGTSALTPGSSALTTGYIYLQYE